MTAARRPNCHQAPLLTVYGGLLAQVKASGRHPSQTPAPPPPRLFTARMPWCHWYPKLCVLCSRWSPQQPEVSSLGRWMNQQIFIKHCASNYGERQAASLDSPVFLSIFYNKCPRSKRGQVTFVRPTLPTLEAMRYTQWIVLQAQTLKPETLGFMPQPHQ